MAGLKNPTVRTRYLAASNRPHDYGRLDFYVSPRELLGRTRMTQRQVEGHLLALRTALNVPQTAIKTPFFVASGISDLARPIFIGGSQGSIDHGFYREAVFWIVSTFARC